MELCLAPPSDGSDDPCERIFVCSGAVCDSLAVSAASATATIRIDKRAPSATFVSPGLSVWSRRPSLFCSRCMLLLLLSSYSLSSSSLFSPSRCDRHADAIGERMVGPASPNGSRSQPAAAVIPAQRTLAHTQPQSKTTNNTQHNRTPINAAPHAQLQSSTTVTDALAAFAAAEPRPLLPVADPSSQ